MFLLGLIFIIVGFAILFLWTHPQAHPFGGLLIVVGLIFIVVALVGTGDVDVDRDRGLVLVGPALWRLAMRGLALVERRLTVR